ncbi:MAG: hypothetical protein J6Y37_17330 [Paludibacteraceae bacterium]|nr:hypothetical protein [Paludibacteraceae bacterium]
MSQKGLASSLWGRGISSNVMGYPSSAPTGHFVSVANKIGYLSVMVLDRHPNKKS